MQPNYDFLVDSHCHLSYTPLRENLPAVLERAKQNNIGIMQNICTKFTEFPEILRQTEDNSHVFCSVGLHPSYASDEAEYAACKWQNIVGLVAKNPKVIGLGETGLDYLFDHSEELKERQKTCFIEHIRAAQHCGLPLIIHTRGAEEDTQAVLAKCLEDGDFTGVLHCFTGSLNLAQAALKMGFYLSVSGIITFKNARELREVFANVPLDRILLETDAPYLAPTPYRGQSNEPSYMLKTAEFLAELRNIELSALVRATTANFARLFTRVPRGLFMG